VAAATLLAAAVLLVNCAPPSRQAQPPGARAFASGEGIGPAARARTLVLYDSTGPWGYLGELYAQQTANLASHFGPWQAVPVVHYRHGLARSFDALVYLGSTYDEPLPWAFLDDVRDSGMPVLWLGANLWQLAARHPGFLAWTVKGYDKALVTGVAYKGVAFDRSPELEGGLLRVAVTDPRRVATLATATHPDGSALPWAVRAGRLTYVPEIPLSYVGPDDRYLVFADLLFDLLAPAAPVRHRALVRLEDVGPDTPPAQLEACVQVLARRRIPFSVAFYPCFRDPRGVRGGGRGPALDLAAAPAMAALLAGLPRRGGTLVMHGTTHQLGDQPNPYSADSASDFEFYRAHLDAGNEVVLDGPPAEDSESWARARMEAGLAAFRSAGLEPPALFEPPHYAASAAAYQAASSLFTARYDRGMYFPGRLDGAAPDYGRPTNQFFPYPVRDVYGSRVVPENLGNVARVEYNHHAPRSAEDILASAARNLAVRDGVASFFYHPALGPGELERIVDGLAAQGWSFVAAGEIWR
jgi:uncharacterized protein YdaL